VHSFPLFGVVYKHHVIDKPVRHFQRLRGRHMRRQALWRIPSQKFRADRGQRNVTSLFCKTQRWCDQRRPANTTVL
jgi:hypothetical protein